MYLAVRRLSSQVAFHVRDSTQLFHKASFPLQKNLQRNLLVPAGNEVVTPRPFLRHLVKKRTVSQHRLTSSSASLRQLTMAPVTPITAQQKVEKSIRENKIVVFSKTFCPFCHKVKDLFKSLQQPFLAVELDILEDGQDLQDALLQATGQKTVPNVFVNGEHLGGCDKTLEAHQNGRLQFLLTKGGQVDGEAKEVNYDYDLLVIGGGSGGLAASKEAAILGKKVAVCDFVKPTPMGTSWGLGGTCVNVGCIPKKLMHQAALLGQAIKDAKMFGWKLPEQVNHDWGTMVQAIQGHIGSLNWGYRVALREKKVTYINSYAEFADGDPHRIRTTDKKGNVKEVTAGTVLLATGGRPRYPDIPGAKEYCITSDDVFSLPYCPGKTLLVGASYIALECAGFLAGLGIDTTVMVRSILLRGFDQQIAEMIGSYMEGHGVKFHRGYIPTKVEQLEAGSPGRLKVTSTGLDGEILEEEYNTVLFAVGRQACTDKIGAEKIGIQLNPNNGKVICDASEQTSVPNVYAIGDILDGKLELTPVAIQAGRLLAKRLYADGTLLTDYTNVPTTVFTPIEYGCVGLSEEDALALYGDDVEIYHSNFTPLEVTVPKRDDNAGYVKLICLKSQNEKVVGFHVLGPNAGEITQGYALGLKLGATKGDFDNLIGIHPTCAEIFTTLQFTKSSGADVNQKGC